MWYVGGSILVLGLVLLWCMIVDRRQWASIPVATEEGAPPRAPRRGLPNLAMIIVAVDVVAGFLLALADEDLGPFAYGGPYRVVGMICWSGQFAALALASALWLHARPAAARSKLVTVGIVLSWVVVVGIGCCYGTMTGM